jgi:hypothetical protein
MSFLLAQALPGAPRAQKGKKIGFILAFLRLCVCLAPLR